MSSNQNEGSKGGMRCWGSVARERAANFIVSRDLISYLNKSGDKFLSITISFVARECVCKKVQARNDVINGRALEETVNAVTVSSSFASHSLATCQTYQRRKRGNAKGDTACLSSRAG